MEETLEPSLRKKEDWASWPTRFFKVATGRGRTRAKSRANGRSEVLGQGSIPVYLYTVVVLCGCKYVGKKRDLGFTSILILL